MAVKANSKGIKGKKPIKKPSKPAKKAFTAHRAKVSSPSKYIVVYGMRIDGVHISKAAADAFGKRRYTVHDLRLMDFIPDPRFRNLMVKIALLDRIEEELTRMYPSVNVIRPNTVTLLVR